MLKLEYPIALQMNVFFESIQREWIVSSISEEISLEQQDPSNYTGKDFKNMQLSYSFPKKCQIMNCIADVLSG